MRKSTRRDVVFFILGSLITLGFRRPDLSSLNSPVVVVDLNAIDLPAAPNPTNAAQTPPAHPGARASAAGARAGADAAATAARCSAVLRECRAAARRLDKEEPKAVGKKKKKRPTLPLHHLSEGSSPRVYAGESKAGKSRRRRRRRLDSIPEAPGGKKKYKVSVGVGTGADDSGAGTLFKHRPLSQPNCTAAATSMNPCYPNRAIEDAMRKHDRLVVDSLAYLQAFAVGEDGARYLGGRASDSPKHKAITLVVLTVNRNVPYLAVLVATLLRGHDPSTLGTHVDLRIVNIERRPCRCGNPLLRDLEARLPFATFHDWTGPYPQHSNITDSKLMYKANQRLDYIRALELCRDEGSKWCLIMEDDAVATANLVPKFLNLTANINAADLAILSLYVPHNDAFSNDDRILVNYYAEKRFDADVKALKFIDPNAPLRGSSPRILYQIEDTRREYGIVANAYPSSVLGRMIEHLSKEDSWDTRYFTDIELMKNFVLKYPSLKKVGVNPSLVNHVGHYSEHRPEESIFRWMSTDVRFQLDDG